MLVLLPYVSNDTGELNEDTTAAADRRPWVTLDTILADHGSRNPFCGAGAELRRIRPNPSHFASKIISSGVASNGTSRVPLSVGDRRDHVECLRYG
jgi:hypothetical protein